MMKTWFKRHEIYTLHWICWLFFSNWFTLLPCWKIHQTTRNESIGEMCHQNTSKLPNTAKYLHWSALHANLILFWLYSLLFSSSLLSGVGTCSLLCNKTTESICIRHISSVRFCRVWQQPTFLQLLFSHFTEGKFCSVSLTSTMWVRRWLFSTTLANNTHVDKSFREFQHFASFEVNCSSEMFVAFSVSRVAPASPTFIKSSK